MRQVRLPDNLPLSNWVHKWPKPELVLTFGINFYKASP